MDLKQMQRILRQAEIIDKDLDNMVDLLDRILVNYEKLRREVNKIKIKDLKNDINDSLDRIHYALSECSDEVQMASVYGNVKECFDDYIEYNDIDV